jgi:hypothetical protein
MNSLQKLSSVVKSCFVNIDAVSSSQSNEARRSGSRHAATAETPESRVSLPSVTGTASAQRAPLPKTASDELFDRLKGLTFAEKNFYSAIASLTLRKLQIENPKGTPSELADKAFKIALKETMPPEANNVQSPF